MDNETANKMFDEIKPENEYVRCKRLADMAWDEFAKLAIGGTNQMRNIIEHQNYENFYGIIPQDDPDFRETSEEELKTEEIKRRVGYGTNIYVLFTNYRNPLDYSVYVSCSSSFRPEKNKKYGYASRTGMVIVLRDQAP